MSMTGRRRSRSALAVVSSPTLLALLVGVSSCGAPDVRRSADAVAPPEIAAGWADVQNGRVWIEAAGRGRALLLVNGGAIDLRQWDDAFVELARRFRVIRYDPRGWGRSPAPVAEHSPIDDMLAVIDRARVDRVTIIGVSMGGGLALDFALAHPGRVDALVLLAPTLGGFEWSREFLERAAGFSRVFERDGAEGLARALIDDAHFAPSARSRPELRDRLRRLVVDNAGVFSLDRTLFRVPRPAIELLDRLRPPVLVLVPTLDHADIARVAGAIKDRAPRTRIANVPGAGHMLHMESPARFVQLVESFLDDIANDR